MRERTKSWTRLCDRPSNDHIMRIPSIFIVTLLLTFMFLIYYFYGVVRQPLVTILPFEVDVYKLKPESLKNANEDKDASKSQSVSSTQSIQPQVQRRNMASKRKFQVAADKNKRGTIQGSTGQTRTLPVMKIDQTVELSVADALIMSLTCTATVGKNDTARYNMWWSGMNHSLWIKQSPVTRQEDYVKRKLFFKPWLDFLAREYTCHLLKTNQPHARMHTKSYVISGNYRGLINSRSSSQNFDNNNPGKWFSNANMCGGDNIWNEYADFHKSVLSGKEKQRYVKYICNDKKCGGYGNRICGITVLLIYAMLTKRALLLDVTVPVDISTYLLPNGIDWNHPSAKGLTAQNFNIMSFKDFDRVYKTFEDSLLGDEYGIVNVRINFGLFYVLEKMKDNLLHNMISMLHMRTHYDLVLLYGCAYNYLFKYQSKTIEAIDTLQHELGLETGKYVAMHVRSHIGDKMHSLRVNYQPMFECAVAAAKTMSQRLNISKVPIFLAADHPLVTQYAIEHHNDSIVLSRAPSFHSDLTRYSGDNATNQYYEGMIGLFSDMEICSRAGALVRSASSTLSEVIGAIHFPSPKRHFHPFYFYSYASVCLQ